MGTRRDRGRYETRNITGRGRYVPTNSEFAGVDFLTLAARIERVGGIPDIQLGALRLLRTLDWPPEVLWLNVRAYLPILTNFGVTRHMLYTDGQLPLPRGASLTRQEAVLGIPDIKPGDLDKIRLKTHRLTKKLESELSDASGVKPCK